MYLGVSIFLSTLLLITMPVMAEPIQIQISPAAKIDSQQALATDYLTKLITERSQGRVQLDQKSSRSSEETLRLLNAGQLQLAIVDLYALAQYFPQLQLFELPFLFQDQQHLDRVINGKIGQQILLTIESEQIKPLRIWNTSFHQLIADRPITTEQQLIGVSIKLPASRILKRYYQLLGAIPVTADKGVSNVWNASLADIASANQAPYSDITITNHAVSGSLLLVEKNFWSQLPNDLKIIVSGAIEDASSYARELRKQQQHRALAELEKRKINIHRLPATQRRVWQKASQKNYPKLMQGLNQQIVEQILKG